ncbi:MAG: hypothetical protein JRJ75_16325, partial [Deltaproteobacteria bacterium]|nr:hypothetical protein [Deltaproteobacteria bacterium]
LFTARGKDKSKLEALIPDTIGEIVPLTGDAIGKIALPEPSAEEKHWPSFIREIILVPSREDEERLDLHITIEPEKIKGYWKAWLEGKGEEAQYLLFDSEIRPQSKSEIKVELEEKMLNRLLREQQVIIEWWDFPEGRYHPINVSFDARQKLPVSPGAGRLSEDKLIYYYQGRITWEELYPDPEGSPYVSEDERFDYERTSQVDTSRICSYQIREFVEALKGIEDDLRAASRSTEPAMRMALQGQVSPLALAKAVIDTVKANVKSPVAAGFQLVEIIGCLEAAKGYETMEKYRDAWIACIDKTIEDIEKLLLKLRMNHPDFFRTQGPFMSYEKAVRKFHRERGANP